nr:MAG TPA: hypothetical protein [Bacteriophage sp.]
MVKINIGGKIKKAPNLINIIPPTFTNKHKAMVGGQSLPFSLVLVHFCW